MPKNYLLQPFCFHFQETKYSDVGLRRTCAEDNTSARAMCVRKCVRKGFAKCACVVGAYGHIFDLQCAITLFILVDREADEHLNHIYDLRFTYSSAPL